MNRTAFFTVAREGQDIEIEIEGEVYGPDPECGMMSHYCEGVWSKHDWIVLTEEEQEKASERLCAIADDDTGDYE